MMSSSLKLSSITMNYVEFFALGGVLSASSMSTPFERNLLISRALALTMISLNGVANFLFMYTIEI